MAGDISRSSFNPLKHFSGVRMQQGRVQLDADWNEQVDIATYFTRAATADLIGPSGAPAAGDLVQRRQRQYSGLPADGRKLVLPASLQRCP